jgi:RimJ/RimL family protein N-acetyltransferase
MKAEEFCGHGYGPDALNALVTHLHRTFGVYEFRVDPSSRNKRAIKAYQKSGFVFEKHKNPIEKSDYSDTSIMIKRVKHRTWS